MKGKNSLLVAMALGIMLSGCRECDDYEYLTFDPSTRAIPTEIGMLELDGLRQIKPYPLAHRIQRQEYALEIETNPKSYLASVIVSIESNDGMTLHIPPVDPSSRSCVSYTAVPPGKIQFTWWGGSNCDKNRFISIDISSRAGQRVANEVLHFDLVKAGTYCVMDGT